MSINYKHDYYSLFLNILLHLDNNVKQMYIIKIKCFKNMFYEMPFTHIDKNANHFPFEIINGLFRFRLGAVTHESA